MPLDKTTGPSPLTEDTDMLDWIIAFIPDWNSWLAFLLYWLPLAFCLYGYLLRSIGEYRDDLSRRAKAEGRDGSGYFPTLKIGDLIGRLFASIVPVVNLGAAVFSVGPEIFSDFFAWLGRVFDQPLVPQRRQGNAP